MAVRAAAARLDASRHQLITIPNPQVGARVITTRSSPRWAASPVHHATLIPQAAEHLAAQLAGAAGCPSC